MAGPGGRSWPALLLAVVLVAAAVVLNERNLPARGPFLGIPVHGWSTLLLAAAGLVALGWWAGGLARRLRRSDIERQAQRAEWEALFEHGPEAELLMEGGGFTLANRAAGALFRGAPEELIGLHPWDISPERQQDGTPSREAAAARLAEAAEGRTLRFEWRHRRLDGSEFEAEVSLTRPAGEPDRAVSWVRDVTAQRESRERLAVANEQLRLLVEGSPHFFFYLQNLSGDTTYVSPTVQAITGRTPEAWLRQSDWFVTGNPINWQARSATWRHLSGELDGEPVLVEVRHANGSTVLLEAYEYGVYRDGRLVGLQGLAHDVTRRARAEALRRAAHRVSEAANSARRVQELFPVIHQIVAELMPAPNFYIALFDPAERTLSFPYWVDEHDPAPASPAPLGSGLTEYVLRTGEPLLATPSVFADLAARGEVIQIGAPSIDWLGVPLKVQERAIGVLVVQSYSEGLRFGDDERELLVFVSSQVAMAIERTRAEEAMRASEARLRDIVEHSSNLFYAHTPDHVLTYASPQTRQFFDCEPEEALVRWTELVTDNPMNREGIELTQRAIDTGEKQPMYELELKGMKGRVIRVEVNEAPVVRDGRTVAIVGALVDVTERTRTTEALRESEERYRRLVERSPDGILVYAEGRVVFANAAAARILGYASPSDIAGMAVMQFVHPASRDSLRERVASVDNPEEMPLLEAKVVRADGAVIDVELLGIPISFGGRPAIQVVARDVTPRRRLEEHLRESQKMEAVGRLAGGVAHDFNNLLQALLSAVQVLRAAEPSAARLGATLAEIEAHVKRGAALARQLLLFSRRQVTRSERVDLNVVVLEAIELVRRLLRENVRLTASLGDGPLSAWGDAGQLEQVLVNLVVNAADAMPDGGELAIRTGSSGVEGWFEVEDSGVGMPEDVVGRIFEPFFTTKRVGQGTGLGLAVVHGIVAQHGGRVEVDSQVGRGSRFRVVLPDAGEREGPAWADDDPASEVRPGSGERVLIVEDEPGAREGLRQALDILGYSVIAVGSGEDAEALPEQPAFDLLLTDLLLPGVHGAELAERLVARWPELRVIVMSGYAEDEAVRRGVSEGNVRFLQKPFDLEVLARELQAALAVPAAP